MEVNPVTLILLQTEKMIVHISYEHGGGDTVVVKIPNPVVVGSIPRSPVFRIGPRSGPEVIKLFSCSTQLSMKFQMLISKKKYQEIQPF